MDIIVTGSIAYDYLMRFPGYFKDQIIPDQLHQITLSFLVEDMTKHWGGNAANIAYSLALLGTRPHLAGTVGRDFGDYRQWLESVGVDTTSVRQIDDVFTASFFANTDLEYNQISSFYSGAMAYAKDYRLEDVYDGKPDMVIISPNDPTAMLNLTDECRRRDIHFIFDPGQQIARFSGEEIRYGLEGAYALVVNAYESELICKKTGLTIGDLRRDVKILVITQGKDGSHLSSNGERIDVSAVPIADIKDPTGVGDAYRSGLLFGIANGWSLKLAGELGSLCAAYVLEQVGTQSHRFTLPEFVTRFRQYYDDQGQLDRLLKSEIEA